MMVAERQLRQFYVELREMFVYQFQEPGLYDEFMERLQKLRDGRRKADVERRLHQKAIEMQARRKKQKEREFVFNVIAGFVLVGIFSLFVWGMIWMFNQKGVL